MVSRLVIEVSQRDKIRKVTGFIRESRCEPVIVVFTPHVTVFFGFVCIILETLC